MSFTKPYLPIATDIHVPRVIGRRLLIGLIWLIFTLMVIHPPFRLPGLPSNVQLHDLFWGFTLGLATLMFIANKQFPRMSGGLILPTFLVYVFMVLTLPLVGMMLFPQIPLAHYMGDLRWIQVLSLVVILFRLYAGGLEPLAVIHGYRFIWVLVLIQIPFLLSQFSYYALGHPPNFLLELWYPGGGFTSVRYGVHIGRYAGAIQSISGFAMLGTIAIMVGALRGTGADKKNMILLILGALYILASGSRAMIFGAPLFLIFIIIFILFRRGNISKKAAKLSAMLVPGFGFVAFLTWYYDFGRLASQGRLQSVIAWITGETGFTEIAGGRGGDRWWLPLQDAWSNWSWFGTLVNPVHALQGYPVMDSYFVFSLAQAGPLIVIPFLVLLILLLSRGLRLLVRKDPAGAIPVGIATALFLSSITGNTMTGLGGRAFLGVAVSILILQMTAEHRNMIQYR